MTLYPLQFTPIIKDYLWGGSRLKEVLHKPVQTETAAESWEISDVKGDVSVVSHGALKGKDLKTLVKCYREDLVGRHVYEKFGTDFPVLIKFIDAAKDLSVQLHPNDALAKERHQSFGKNEMWHVMQAANHAELILGFNKELKQDEFLSVLRDGRLMEVLNREQVHPGDTFFINTGKVHAIGAGILLVEIQQTSNITYRIYDYDRIDKDGNKRQLHTELALDAIDYSKNKDFKVTYSDRENTENILVDTPYFVTHYLHYTQPTERDVAANDSFHIYICTEGTAVFKTAAGEYSLSMGETLLIPACIPNFSIDTAGAKFLEVHL